MGILMPLNSGKEDSMPRGHGWNKNFSNRINFWQILPTN